MTKSVIDEEVKNFKISFIELPNLVILTTVSDGSCFFHSVLRAFNTSYITSKSITDRVNLARTFRNALADRLDEIDPVSGKNYYSVLNQGRLSEISEGIKEYTKDGLQKELRSEASVDNIYQELISNALHIDIYIIDGAKKDIFSVGNSFDCYYKGRNSIILYYSGGHYEVIGLKHSNGEIDTIFTPLHPLIQSCRSRLISNIHPPITSPTKYKLRSSSPK
jgi:hypothetical protein